MSSQSEKAQISCLHSCKEEEIETEISTVSKLQAAVIGGGPAGSSAAEALATGGVETFLFERSPTTTKPCGGAIPLCMLSEFSIPSHLIDRRVTQMRIISPSSIVTDLSKTLKPHEFIAMLRREVLDSFLRQRAESSGTTLLKALVTNLMVLTSTREPYVIHYTMDNCQHQLAVDDIIGADGANSRLAKSINAGNYTTAIAYQERIKLPEDKMGGDRHDVLKTLYQIISGIKARVKSKIEGGEVIKVEAHPIPQHPRPIRFRGRVALVGDAAGYVTNCSGEGIYFAAKSGRMCGNAAREALVELCRDEYVQRMTFDSYFYKKLASGNRWEDAKIAINTISSLVRYQYTVVLGVTRMDICVVVNDSQASVPPFSLTPLQSSGLRRAPSAPLSPFTVNQWTQDVPKI
ncbi:hypothetical protein MTR67_004042 [Solanum verrucosum]|uniref:FAD-binding domain-containing protein n=1 Tax=Solanum verrucosum TaxID=315347 RepID=A0AAF0T7E5_SOLVR|nr:hypothetical protein MTR67_004042 [Solanum verrucosum]